MSTTRILNSLLTITRAVRVLFWDALLLGGCAVFVYGVWRAWAPAGFMVAGLLLVAIAFLFGARKVPTISTEARK